MDLLMFLEDFHTEQQVEELEEQEAEDRRKAYESGVPHGYVPRGFRYEGMPTIKITVQSELVSPLSSSLPPRPS